MKSNPTWWSNAILFLVAVLVFVVDQVTKQMVVHYFQFYADSYVPVVGNLLRLTYAQNRGAAFGILPNQTILLVVIAITVVGVIIVYQRYLSSQRLLLRVCLGMLLGGALGNLVDRLRLQYVVDFIQLPYWPVFNVADSSIVISVTIIAVYLLFGSDNRSKDLRKDTSTDGSDQAPPSADDQTA